MKQGNQHDDSQSHQCETTASKTPDGLQVCHHSWRRIVKGKWQAGHFRSGLAAAALSLLAHFTVPMSKKKKKSVRKRCRRRASAGKSQRYAEDAHAKS